MCKKLFYLIPFVLVSGLVITSVAEAVDPDDPSLIGWWKLDEVSGTIAYDSSGNGIDGEFTGDPQWVDGVIDGALQFDGIDDGVDTGYTEDLVNFSIAFWVISPAAPANSWGGDPVGRQFNFMMAWDREDDFRGGVLAHIGGWKSASYEPLEPNTWHHLAGTYDGEALKAYRDGVLITSTPASGLPRSESRTLKIGRGLSTFFDGTVDDVQVYDRALTEAEIQQLIASSPLISVPNPADGEREVPQDVVLSWRPAVSANTHDVYLGTVFNDVQDANSTNPLGVLVSQNQDPNSYTPAERLQWDQTYYWRVDEVNAPPDFTVFEGNVWQFTLEPSAYPITGENITAIASSSNSADEGPENTINGSGLDADDLHSEDPKDMWLSGSEPLGAWIEYEFDRVYKLHEMWVWNYNSLLEPSIGFGLKDVTIEYSANGADWTQLGGVSEFVQAPGAAGYALNTTVDLTGVVAKYVKITANSKWGDILPQYGLSEVRFLYVPVWVTEPAPDFGATDVSIGTIDKPTDVTLGFRAGREAAEHNVYLSTDEQAVIDGTAGATIVTEASYGPLPLDLDKTYYWRVDEVNEAETPTTWAGDVWDFTTQEFFVVDDFEDYNDYPPHEIYTTWEDGYEDLANGSTVGHLTLPSAETVIVHGGSQAMPFFYDNTAAGYSEATMTLVSGRDWTVRDIGTLSLWFRGNPVSAGNFTEAPAGTYTMTASGADIGGTSDEFHFAYKQLSGPGSIIAKVESVEATHNWAKAGVMIRDTLEADSTHAMVVVTPSQGVSFERRWTAGESTSTTTQTGITAPQWVKIQRDLSGSVTAFYSGDGNEWMQLGISSEMISMTAPMYIGLALTAHDVHAICEAEFSNVQITGTVDPQWSNQDIGILSNDPESMYVALANAGGTPAAVYYGDPDAIPTQIGDWTQWDIALEKFAQQGVNLADVDKLSIGVGDKANPQAGGSGTMYFDDVSLHPSRSKVLPQDPDLVAYYKLDGDADDSSGNDRHGTVDGDPQWVDGVIGGALQFDGIDDGVDTGYTEDLVNFSIAFWVISPAAPANSWGGDPVGRQFNFMMAWDREDDFRGGVLAHIGGWKSASYEPLEPNTWHHLAGTYDGEALKAYRDGVLITSTPASGLPRSESRTLKIGRGLSTFFDGIVDDVYIYSRALTEAEVADLAGMTTP